MRFFHQLYLTHVLVILIIVIIFTKNVNSEKFKRFPTYDQLHKSFFDDEKWSHACGPEHSNNWNIYCQGRILESVNFHHLFPDSKDFVDSPLKNSPNETLMAFDRVFGHLNTQEINATELQSFIQEHFDPPGSELMNWTPADWRQSPSRLMEIEDPTLRQWALELNGIWKILCKKMNPELQNLADRNSLIYVPHEFIAPGGRFREFYYWDAYWIVRGLMASQMFTTAERMIRNLAHMVERYGFVPNGGRVYYLRRSQPPMLAPMVYEFWEASDGRIHDREFLREMLPILEKELLFWETQRTVEVELPGENWTKGKRKGARKYKAFRYSADSNVPRPESFKEDMTLAAGLSQNNWGSFFKDVASAAEAGWDFSTRWFQDSQNLTSITTTEVLPVDLNAFMCWNYNILSELYREIGNLEKTWYYRNRYNGMQDLMEDVFYNRTMGVWFDWNMRKMGHNVNFYPSVAVPLFTNCYDDLNQIKSRRLFQYMKENGVFDFPGGIPTSMQSGSAQQWDFPNGWSPLNHIVIEGLRKSENAEMQEQAFQLAKKWVFSNYRVFARTSHMWEKYDVTGNVPMPGQGGEYKVQDGFGWTNGVILDLLVSYYDRLSWKDDNPSDNQSNNTSVNPREYSTTPASQSPNGSFKTSLLASYLLIEICLTVFSLL